MTFRKGWIVAGLISCALLPGTAAFSQATDAESSASVRAEAPNAGAATDATSSASRAEETPAARPAGPSRPALHIDWVSLVRVQLYRLAEGPLLAAACLLFVLGFAWRIRQLRRVTRPVTAPPVAATARLISSGSERADLAFLTKNMSILGRAVFFTRRWLRRTVLSSSPVAGVVSMAFHVGLFFIPLLLPGHNYLFRQKYHAGLPTLPEAVMDRLTIILLALAAFFLLRRLVFPRVRALSTAQDYLVLLMVIAPFFTGLVAYHHWMDYRAIMALHMTAADLLIAAIPFSKLGHMPFLLYARLFVHAERSWRPAARRW